MAKTDLTSWTNLAVDSWMLSCEATSVMWLRGLRLMAGGKPAEHEMQRMVQEKFVANMMLLPFLMVGGANQTPQQLSARAISHYRKPVLENRRRLSR